MPTHRSIWGERRPVFVAIVGGSGSGKTWMANRICARLGKEAGRLSLDDFYLDRSHLHASNRRRVNFDHPRAIDWPLFLQTLNTLSSGKTAHAPDYDFATHSRRRKPKIVTPRRLIVVDGLWLLRNPSVRKHFSLKIFIACPAKLRLERRLARDCGERSRTRHSIRKQFFEAVAPMHKRFVDPQIRRADVVLPTPISSKALNEIIKQLKSFLIPSPL